MKCKEYYCVTKVNGEYICDCELYGTDTCGLEDETDERGTVNMSEWIKCSERLPEKDGRYLVVNKHGNIVYIEEFSANLSHIDSEIFNDGQSGFYAYDYDEYSDRFGSFMDITCDFTYWMPLPEPPVEEAAT